jgi:hypothetical protein
MPAFYKHALWIPQHFPLTNPDLHHGLLGGVYKRISCKKYIAFIVMICNYCRHWEKAQCFAKEFHVPALQRTAHRKLPG